eukprot:TRINITY_DN3778_c0_g1_i1.p1 TRINITY_DN3778_c0_g1~~TRINITY_DN3778_c0_g1_i1.p1  ORF type:complete len:441 (+),score=132.64 TRINITY_DN3778_c0_g1_i1:86-1408(+)
MTDIFTLCEEGKVEEVEDLVKGHPICINDYNKHGVTPLGLAVQKKHVNLVKRLLAWEADPNARATEEAGTYKGYTPMHFASKNDDVCCLQLLFERGASPKLQGKDGWSPLHTAAFAGALESIKWLISKKVDLNVANEHKITPLIQVVSQGKLEASRLLINAGAKTTLKDITGDTIFHHAMHFSMYKLFEGSYTLPDIQIDAAVFLALHGVDPELLNRDGQKATHYVEKEFGSNNFVMALKLIHMNHASLLKGEGDITERWNYLTLCAIKNRQVFENLGVPAQQAKDLIDLLFAFENERKTKKDPSKNKRVPKKRVTPLPDKKAAPSAATPPPPTREEETDNAVTPETPSIPSPVVTPVEKNVTPVLPVPQLPVVTQQVVPTTIEHRVETKVEKIVEVKWQHPSVLPPPVIDLRWAYHNRVAILCCIISFLLGSALTPVRC